MPKQLIVFSLVCCILGLTASAMAPTPPAITQLSHKINAELNKMDLSLANAAQQLSQTNLNDAKTRNILEDLYFKYPSTVVVSTIGSNGTLLMICPQKYRSSGESIKDQAHFRLASKTQKPVLSNMFKTVEGFYAASLTYPVFSNNNDPIGFISLVFQPQAFVKNIIQSYIDPFPSMEALAIQQDGRIIYDRDILQVGQMTFSDPMYQNSPSLLAIANRMTSEASGSGTYTFLDKTKRNTINKTTQWDTISLYQTQWRLIFAF